MRHILLVTLVTMHARVHSSRGLGILGCIAYLIGTTYGISSIHTYCILPQELSSALLTWREFRHAPAAAGSGGICWHVFMRRWQLVVAVVVVIPPETPSLSAR